MLDVSFVDVENVTNQSSFSLLDISGLFNIETNYIDQDIKKQRGRPRKEFNKNIHKLSDSEPDTKKLLKSTQEMIYLDYKEYIQEGLNPTETLKNISMLYKISYQQAYNICSDYL